MKEYKVPKEHGDEDELTKKIRDEGCAPKLEESIEKDDNQNETSKREKKSEKKIKGTEVIDNQKEIYYIHCFQCLFFQGNINLLVLSTVLNLYFYFR